MRYPSGSPRAASRARPVKPTSFNSPSPAPPLRPSSPKLMLNTLLAAFLGGVLGIGIAIFLEMIHPRVRLDEDLVQLLGVPILGKIGSVRYAHWRRALVVGHPLRRSSPPYDRQTRMQDAVMDKISRKPVPIPEQPPARDQSRRLVRYLLSRTNRSAGRRGDSAIRSPKQHSLWRCGFANEPVDAE